MIKEGQWVCGAIDRDIWTYPGKVLAVNDHYVIFEIQDMGGSFEVHRHPSDVRIATKADFDRQILDINKELIKGEEIVSFLERVQQNVPD